METRFPGSCANADYNNSSVVSHRVEIEYVTSLTQVALVLGELIHTFQIPQPNWHSHYQNELRSQKLNEHPSGPPTMRKDLKVGVF